MASPTLPMVLSIDGEPVDAVLECGLAAAYVLVFSTTVAERRVPVDLHSTYVGHRDGETMVTHLALLPRVAGGRLSSRRSSGTALPVGQDNRAPCLHDHLQHLVGLLHELGYTASVRVGHEAVTYVNA